MGPHVALCTITLWLESFFSAYSSHTDAITLQITATASNPSPSASSAAVNVFASSSSMWLHGAQNAKM